MIPPRPRVLVAMSGGVDSSVAAALLLERGYDVVGCFMRLGSPGESLDEFSPDTGVRPGAKIGHQGCCSITDAADARRVAATLGIPLYVCNFKRDFGRVMDYFADEYLAGRTPNPCVRCNDWLKFGKLHDYARSIGASWVASGHYARIDHDRPGGARLLRAVDARKDQSYVLFGAPRSRLAQMLLPIGAFEKAFVREEARRFGLGVASKPDSQEICFVPGNDYAAFVESRRPGSARPGPIVGEGGEIVGAHAGQHRFTIGQRRGLSLSLGHPIYVTGRDAGTNAVTVGTREALACAACRAGEANWLVDAPRPGQTRRVLAKYRYNSPAAGGVVSLLPDTAGPTHSGRTGAFEVAFDRPQSAVAPGQAIVLYDESDPDVVLGGGWISSASPAFVL